MNTLLSVSELNDERYVQINDLVSEDAVMNFIDACEAIETELAKHNIDAKEMYKYMLTLMLNQAQAKHNSYIHVMKKFTESKVFKILKKRWAGKDMEKYFEEKGKAHFEKLKKEITQAKSKSK